jgi:hypothetical protein
MNETKNLLKDVDISNWQQFEIAEIPIGRYAGYEILLEHKIHPKDLDYNYWEQYSVHLEQCILTYFASIELVLSDKPDVAVVYNNLYSTNRTFESVMNLHGVPTYRLHGGLDFRHIHETICLSQGIEVNLKASRSQYWKAYCGVTLRKDQINQVLKNQMYLSKAKSFLTYSRALTQTDQKEIRKKYLIDDSQKVIICATSSPDEMAAAALVSGSLNESAIQSSIYIDQIQWLKDVIDIASRRSDYHVLIRIHPREYPNKRDGVRSTHAQLLEDALNDLPRNVHVVWPSENESIYDLIKVADVLLSGISSVGGEFLAFGVPVICHEGEKLNAYPAECVRILSKREEYEALIDAVLVEGVSLDKVITYFRWKNFQFRNLSTSPKPNAIGRVIWRLGLNSYYASRMKYLRSWPFIGRSGVRLFRTGSRLGLDEKQRIGHVFRHSLTSLMAVSPDLHTNSTDSFEERNHISESVNRLRKTMDLKSLF